MFFRSVWSIEGNAYRALIAQFKAFGIEQLKAMMPKESLTDDFSRQGLPVQRHGDLAIISLRGPMMKSPGWIGRFFGFCSTADVTAAFKAATVDDEVKKILLVVDSPGGEVDGLAQLADAVYETRSKKPVVAFVDGMAASAAYFIASQANKIYMNRMDMVGSIGTIMMLYDWHLMYEAAGVEAVPIATGWFKAAGAEGTQITEEQRAEFQRLVDIYFADFLDAVSRGRGMGKESVKKLADGRVFVGPEAKRLGLVDGFKTLDEAIVDAQANRGVRRRTAANRAMKLIP